jgi:hypothetical protein
MKYPELACLLVLFAISAGGLAISIYRIIIGANKNNSIEALNDYNEE